MNGKEINYTEDEREIFEMIQQVKIKIIFLTDLRTELQNEKYSYSLKIKQNDRSYLDISEEVNAFSSIQHL